MPTVDIKLKSCEYQVAIAPGALADLGENLSNLGARSAVIISDSTVSALYADQALTSLCDANIKSALISFPAGEQNKNLHTVEAIFDKLFALDIGLDRSTIIVGLGGGVSTDIAGFIAATAMRGLSWVACPTTLLASVDASVGGKTGVDHSAGKNLIGAFHQPARVIIDVNTLKTLPACEMRNGLAECVKHAVIADDSLLDFISQNSASFFTKSPGEFKSDILAQLIARNVQIKADIVQQDERESGKRAFLNLGHTVGHALELLVGYENLSHGQAVSLGMIAADHIALNRGLISAKLSQKIANLLAKIKLPVSLGKSCPDAEKIFQTMQLDKKNQSGKIRMVLPKNNSVEIFDNIEKSQILSAIQELEI